MRRHTSPQVMARRRSRRGSNPVPSSHHFPPHGHGDNAKSQTSGSSAAATLHIREIDASWSKLIHSRRFCWISSPSRPGKWSIAGSSAGSAGHRGARPGPAGARGDRSSL